MALLEIRKLTMQFGGLAALQEMTFDVHNNEILGLIGPNGAGKTTAFNVITGDYKPSGGSIRFQGKDIAGRKAYQVSRLGISRILAFGKTFCSDSICGRASVSGKDS